MTTDVPALTILIVDDERLVRSGLTMLLEVESNITVIGEATNGQEAVEQTRLLRPDVVLMDFRMPVLDGIEATRQIVNEDTTGDTGCSTHVLMLTTYDLDEIVRDALRAKASGFILKEAEPEELMLAIRAVAAGAAWLHPTIAKRLLDEFATRPDDAITSIRAEMEKLTQREREVLTLAAHGFSNREIATRLFVAEATIKTHVGNVLMKLDLQNRTQAVIAAYRTGLVLPTSVLGPEP